MRGEASHCNGGGCGVSQTWLCGAAVVQPWLWCGDTVKDGCGGSGGGPEDELVAAVCVKLEDGGCPGRWA